MLLSTKVLQSIVSIKYTQRYKSYYNKQTDNKQQTGKTLLFNHALMGRLHSLAFLNTDFHLL